jgi:hypothetical protein
MSISHCNTILFNMYTLESYTTMGGLDLAITEEILLMRTSRTATFTLSSSSSSSSSYSNLYNHQHGRTTTTTTMYSSTSNSYISEHRPLIHSQSLTLDCQRRRPTIYDPYQIIPNLQILDDWMIVSVFICSFLWWNFKQSFSSLCTTKRKIIRHETDDRGDKWDRWRLVVIFKCISL